MANSTGFLGKKHADKTREKIKNSQVVNRLIAVAEGKADMSPTQLRAAEILLKKALPDLSSVALETESESGVAFPSVVVLQGVRAK